MIAQVLAVSIALLAPDTGRPNVLFILSDDQRADAIGSLGNPQVRTPFLDALAARGTVFDRAYCMGSESGAVCLPSRAMILTGATLFRIDPSNPPQTLLPEVFRAAGYATFGTGKWHNGRAAFARSFSDGGSVFFGGMGSHTELLVHAFDPAGAYPKEDRRKLDRFSSTQFVDEAIGFLEHLGAEESFFCYVSFTAPHDPRTPPEPYRDLYAPADIVLPPNFLPFHPFDNGEMRIRDEALAPWPRTEAQVRAHLAEYYGMVTQMDAQVGRLLGALEESGHADDTLVVFTSDHGLALGSHGLLGKQNLYEHSTRSPLILAGPGIPAGGRSAAFAYLFDLFPTLCDLAGLAIPTTVEGVSLTPALSDPDWSARGSVFTAYKSGQRAVRDARFKLIRYPQVDRTQVFDLVADPHETRDLSADAALAGERERLWALLETWQGDLDDPAPLRVDRPRDATFHVPGMDVAPGADGSFTLVPAAARVVGQRLRYQVGRDNLGAWFEAGDRAEWDLVGVRPGAFEVELTLGAEPGGQGFRLRCGSGALDGETRSTGGLETYRCFDLGRLTLTGSEATLILEPRGDLAHPLMNFRRMVLRPVSD